MFGEGGNLKIHLKLGQPLVEIAKAEVGLARTEVDLARSEET